MMHFKSQRRMAAELLKCGVSRIRIEESKDVEEALTRNDVRKLIVKGLIKKIPAKGTGRARAKKILSQKKKGRRAGRGSRQGTRGTRDGDKRNWMKRVRALRALLSKLRDAGKITTAGYRRMYMLTKGNMFRNKRHMMAYLKDKEMIGKAEVKTKVKAVDKAEVKPKAAKAKKAAPKKAKVKQ